MKTKMSTSTSTETSSPSSKNPRLPSRLSETSFRRYEPFIKEVVDIFPRPLQVAPSLMGLAPTTFAARFRDAKNSLALYQWQTDVNLARFMQIQSEIEASHQGDFVVIGSAETVQQTKPSGSAWPPGFMKHLNTLNASDSGARVVMHAEVDLIRACALVIHSRVFSGPIDFVDHLSLLPDFLTELEATHDIAIEVKSPTHFLML